VRDAQDSTPDEQDIQGTKMSDGSAAAASLLPGLGVNGFGVAGFGFGFAEATTLPSSTHPVISVSQNLTDRVEDADEPAGSPASRTGSPVNRARAEVLTSPALATTNSIVSTRALGSHSIQTPQTSPSRQSMSANVSQAVEEDGEKPDDIPILASGILKPATIAGGSSNGADASRLETSSVVAGSSMDERRTRAGEVEAHRSFISGDAGAPASVAGRDKPSIETAAADPQTLGAQTSHSAGAVVNAASAEQSTSHAGVQSSGTEAPAMVRDPMAAHGAPTGAIAVNRADGAQPATAQETFAALDAGTGAGTAVGTPNWIHAGGRQAEAGFEDPALGWVSVRADLSAGGVHAAVIPGSTEAAQALSGHLAGLSAYLSDQHTPVATLTIAVPGNGGTESGLNQGMQHGTGQETGQGTGQGVGQDIDQGMQQSAGQGREQNAAPMFEARSQSNDSANASISAAKVAPATGFVTMAPTGTGRGMHISVMA
jgi:hypothetical protein